ncbi:MAG: hypothetical protein ACOXZM_07415 [Eubacteriales bacterium]
MRIIVLCMLLPVLLCGCTPKPETPAVTTARPDRVEILCKALLEAEGLPETTRCDLADTAALYDISEDMLHNARVCTGPHMRWTRSSWRYSMRQMRTRGRKSRRRYRSGSSGLRRRTAGRRWGCTRRYGRRRCGVSGTVCAVIIAGG